MCLFCTVTYPCHLHGCTAATLEIEVLIPMQYHFCPHVWLCKLAGEDQEGIKPKIQMLHRNGIGGILDYAAEDDMPEEEGPSSRAGPNEKVVARTFDYGSEAICDGHMKTFMKSIEAAAEAPGRGFAAIKVTMPSLFALIFVHTRNMLVTIWTPDQLASSHGHCHYAWKMWTNLAVVQPESWLSCCLSKHCSGPHLPLLCPIAYL